MTRGEVYWADFGLPQGSEPGFRRPVLIVQANSFNRSRINTVIVVPFSTNLVLADAPGNVLVEPQESGLGRESVLVVSQLSVLDRGRLLEKVGALDPYLLLEAEEGLRLVLGLDSFRTGVLR